MLGVLPAIGGLVMTLSALWQLVAMVVAVRQALDYTSTGRAVAVCVVGFVVQLLVLFAFVALVGGSVAAIGAAARP